jgi:hypothetical protein
LPQERKCVKDLFLFNVISFLGKNDTTKRYIDPTKFVSLSFLESDVLHNTGLIRKKGNFINGRTDRILAASPSRARPAYQTKARDQDENERNALTKYSKCRTVTYVLLIIRNIAILSIRAGLVIVLILGNTH